MIQELVGLAIPAIKKTDSWLSNIIATILCVSIWGYFLYQGAVDPLGGINTLWPLFGIANQMLAAIALTLCLVVVMKKKLDRYAWVPGVPAAWLIICTLSAGWVKLFDPKIGFPAAANKYANGIASNTMIAPAKTIDEMQRIVTNNNVDSGLTALFMLLVIATVVFGLRAIIKARSSALPTANEEPYVPLAAIAR
jgi:carbon starvation protein